MTEQPRDAETIAYRCAHCGEPIWVAVDVLAGQRQDMVEDCAVCCRPNHLRVTIDRDGDVVLETSAE
jgi:hypothetical protein